MGGEYAPKEKKSWTPPIQSLLNQNNSYKIGHPLGRHEQEAERISGEVMRKGGSTASKSNSNSIGPTIDMDLNLQEARNVVAPHDFGQIEMTRGSGRPLPKSERDYFQPLFEKDLSDVRIHTGTKAEELSEQINASAFTVGKDVYFGKDEFKPGTEKGRELISHEIAHTVQETGDRIMRQPKEGDAGKEDFMKPRFIFDSPLVNYKKMSPQEIWNEYYKIVEHGRKLGFNMAADFLEFWLTKKHDAIQIPMDKMRSFSEVREAEANIKEYTLHGYSSLFYPEDNKMSTFEKYLIYSTEYKKKFDEYDDYKFANVSDIWDGIIEFNTFSPGLSAAMGEFVLKGNVDGFLKKISETEVYFEGFITFEVSEGYDWVNNYKKGLYIPGYGNVPDAAGIKLTQAGLAKEFVIGAKWKQPLKAWLRLGKKNKVSITSFKFDSLSELNKYSSKYK